MHIIGIIIALILAIVLALLVGAIIALIVGVIGLVAAVVLYFCVCYVVCCLIELAYKHLLQPAAVATGRFSVFAWRSGIKPGCERFIAAASDLVIKTKTKIVEMYKAKSKPTDLPPPKMPKGPHSWK